MIKKFFKANLTVSLLIVLSLLIIINNFFRFFQNKTAHQFEPWLTNYQGGFVRRGLPGEFFFQIYEIFNIHLGWIIFAFVSILYLLFYLNIFNLIKEIKLNKIFIFVIFSPIAFYFPVLNSKATGHKEIIFLYFLSFFCLLLPKMKRIHANYVMIFMCLFIGLSHEGLIFYLTYLIIPFIVFFKFENFKDLLFNLLPIIILSLALIIIVYIFNGSKQHVIDICNSIKLYANPGCETFGKIAHLQYSIEDNRSFRSTMYGSGVYSEYLRIYSIGFIVGFLPLIILYAKSKLLIPIVGKNFNPLLFLFVPLILSFPIYYIAADWGRYFYISYLSSFIIVIFCLGNKIFSNKTKRIRRER